MYKLFILLCIAIVIQTNAQQHYRVVTYNVENLFDTQSNDMSTDVEFTPYGMKRWVESRYKNKLLHIGRVLHAISDVCTPLIGIQEIENSNVLYDLVSRTALADKGYSFLHRDGPDKRGIDVALLYLPSFFKPIETNYLTATFSTREVLYCKGLLVDTDTVHIFVCHLPSKRNGKKKSQSLRTEVLELITIKCDSISKCTSNAHILVMGDFNMHFSEPPMRAFPFIKNKELHPDSQLFNSHKPNITQGTYKFKGVWSCLDHILVSESWMNARSKLIMKNNAQIYYRNNLLIEDRKYGGFKPLSTYHGPLYQGGISDHLPIYLDFGIRQP